MSNPAPSPLRSHSEALSLMVLVLLPTALIAETGSNQVQELRAEVDQLTILNTINGLHPPSVNRRQTLNTWMQHATLH
jgi:hypothetical protein